MTSGRASKAVFLVVRDPSLNEFLRDLDRYMHITLWVQVAHRFFIEGFHMTKNTASGLY